MLINKQVESLDSLSVLIEICEMNLKTYQILLDAEKEKWALLQNMRKVNNFKEITLCYQALQN